MNITPILHLQADHVEHICKQKGCTSVAVGQPDIVHYCTNHKDFVEMEPIGRSNALIRAKAIERLDIEMDCA